MSPPHSSAELSGHLQVISSNEKGNRPSQSPATAPRARSTFQSSELTSPPSSAIEWAVYALASPLVAWRACWYAGAVGLAAATKSSARRTSPPEPAETGACPGRKVAYSYAAPFRGRASSALICALPGQSTTLP